MKFGDKLGAIVAWRRDWTCVVNLKMLTQIQEELLIDSAPAPTGLPKIQVCDEIDPPFFTLWFPITAQLVSCLWRPRHACEASVS